MVSTFISSPSAINKNRSARYSNAFMLTVPSQNALFRKSPRSAPPHHQFMPFPSFLAAFEAIIKRLSVLSTLGWSGAILASELNTHPPPPSRAISALANALPETARFAVAPIRPLADAPLAFRFLGDKPSDLFAAGAQFPSICGLAIQEPLASNHRKKSSHALPVCLMAGIPAKFKFAGVFRKMFTADAMPRAINAAL